MLDLLTFAPLFAVSRLWYSLPLVVAISLVYGATRHELMPQILEHSTKFGVWILTFMLAIFAVTVVLSKMI